MENHAQNTVNNVYSPTFNIFTEKIRTFFAEVDPASETTGAGLLVGSAAAPTS
jgi:hypothetical protein